MEMRSKQNNTQLAAMTRDHGFGTQVSSIKELVDWYACARVWDNEFDALTPTLLKRMQSLISDFLRLTSWG
jgi:hypothetical protein